MSSRDIYSEIVEGFEHLKQERKMKEQTGSFDVALRNMIDTLNQGQSTDSLPIHNEGWNGN